MVKLFHTKPKKNFHDVTEGFCKVFVRFHAEKFFMSFVFVRIKFYNTHYFMDVRTVDITNHFLTLFFAVCWFFFLDLPTCTIMIGQDDNCDAI